MSRILLVDDDELLLTVLKALLENAGYEIMTAGDGNTALNVIQAEALDLVISDIRMRPMNGIELLRKIRGVKPAIPVIMVTAYANPRTAQEAKQLGAFAYMSKPFTNDEVVTNVKEAIASAAPANA